MTLVVLGGAVLFNIVLFLTVPIYPLLFIGSSFILFMFYFITLLIPHYMKKTAINRADIARYFSGLMNRGIIHSSQRFTRIFINAFFINCRPLFFGFTLIFSLDIVIVIFKYLHGTLAPSHAGIILFQAGAIIVFYYAVWKLEPYSTDFSTDVRGIRKRLIHKKIPESVVSFVFLAGAVLALASIVSAIILLPGITFSNVLSVEEFDRLSHVFLVIGIVVASLYFIFRYIHGITSKDLLTRFSRNKEACLRRQIELTQNRQAASGSSPAGAVVPPETLYEAAELLLEVRIYQVERKTIFGTFPVYIVNPDFSVIIENPEFPRPVHDTPPEPPSP